MFDNISALRRQTSHPKCQSFSSVVPKIVTPQAYSYALCRRVELFLKHHFLNWCSDVSVNEGTSKENERSFIGKSKESKQLENEKNENDWNMRDDERKMNGKF